MRKIHQLSNFSHLRIGEQTNQKSFSKAFKDVETNQGKKNLTNKFDFEMGCMQRDQIGRIFAIRANLFCLGHIFKSKNCPQLIYISN
jgi:hypothetical protein